MCISRDDLDWVFPSKYSLKFRVAVRGFTLNITPKVNDDLRNLLELSTGLINKESGQEEFSSISTKEHFFSRRKGIEEAVEKLNKIAMISIQTKVIFYMIKAVLLIKHL